MKKKYFLVILFLILAVFLSGCSGEKKETEPEVKQTVEQKQQLAERPFSNLMITDVNVSDGEVTISGNTDLPNGATLIVGFDVWGRFGSDFYIGVTKKTIISNGKFKAVLLIPQREEFKKGPYEVSVLFTPRGQSDKIIQIVGEFGENLRGELVDDSKIFITMKLVEKKELQLTITPQ